MPSVSHIVSYTCRFLLLTQVLTVLTVGVRMTTAFVDFNGIVPEKFDAVRLTHLVDTAYGNQGMDFKMVPREGWGWMNGTSELLLYSFPILTTCPRFVAAYEVGLSFLTNRMGRAVAVCTSPEVFFSRIMMGERAAASPPSATNDALGLAMENLTISPTISGLGSVTPPPS